MVIGNVAFRLHRFPAACSCVLGRRNRGFDRLGQLEPDDLFDAMHAAVLAAALDLRSDGRPVNVVTLRSRFSTVPFGDGEQEGEPAGQLDAPVRVPILAV